MGPRWVRGWNRSAVLIHHPRRPFGREDMRAYDGRLEKVCDAGHSRCQVIFEAEFFAIRDKLMCRSTQSKPTAFLQTTSSSASAAESSAQSLGRP